jgi:hypothetical protein
MEINKITWVSQYKNENKRFQNLKRLHKSKEHYYYPAQKPA